MKKIVILIISLYFNNGAYSQTSEDYFNSGFVKDSLSDYDNAIQDFTRAIDLNPNCTGCYILRYNSQVKMDYYVGAIQDLSVLLDEFNQEHKFDFLYLERGRYKAKHKDYDEAINDFDIYIELYPQKKDGYFNRGLTKFILEDYKGTVIDMTKVIERNPKDDVAFYYRGCSKKELKDYRGAILDFSKAIFLKPRNEEYYEKRIEVKALTTDFKAAIEDCNLLLKINPNNGKAYCGRGIAKIGLNQKDAGCLDLSKSGEMGFEKAYEIIEEYCQ